MDVFLITQGASALSCGLPNSWKVVCCIDIISMIIICALDSFQAIGCSD
jgi:hypothetical protein